MGTLASQTLILVPTRLEEDLLLALGGFSPEHARLARCGFGVVSSAARTAQLLQAERPRRVLLLGIAGSFDLERAPLATAASFARVRLDGIGVGSGTGAAPLPPSGLGFPQWDGPPGAVFETLELADAAGAELLSVCAASADAREAALRHERFPAALGEDMEGFAVALACHMAGVPLVVVRGFSNRVGARERAGWRVREALAAVRDLALERLESWTEAR